MLAVIKFFLKSVGSLAFIFDIILLPLTITSAVWFRAVKFIGLKKFYLTQNTLRLIGVFPIVNHYYEPQFDFSDYKQKNREMHGIDFRDNAQLDFLREFNFQQELLTKPVNKAPIPKFYYNNGSFPSGDAECYYSIIRNVKPKRIIEIGSGYSTLIASEAIFENMKEDSSQITELTCIEPYEMPWLNQLEVNLIREKVEDVEIGYFKALNNGDILFIDSSHVIRPQGDVLCEIFELLPSLKSGVFIHFHDIYTPLNYPENWLKEEYRLWNEQYLLEAFLSYNNSFEVVLAMSYLTYKYPNEACKAFPVLAKDKKRIPGSIWLRKK